MEDPQLGRFNRKKYDMQRASQRNRMMEDIMGGDSGGTFCVCKWIVAAAKP